MQEITNFDEPFKLFTQYFDMAKNNQQIVEPTAMCLATTNSGGKVSARMVLLKKYNQKGFYFFTNFNSRKSQEIIANPNVAICFYWGILGIQVRVVGIANIASKSESDEYFASRRRESQIGAWASIQSQPMLNSNSLEERIKFYQQQFATTSNIPRPEFWGGFIVNPQEIEFWQEGEFRLHHRIHYSKLENGNNQHYQWQKTTLYP